MDVLKTDTSIGIAVLTFFGTLLASKSFGWAALAMVLAALMIWAGFDPRVWEWAAPQLQKLWGWLQSLRRKDDADHMQPYDVLLGHHPLTGAADVENLRDLGHIGVYGQTRYGKTTWLHSIIHNLIENHAPSELKIAISDPKTVDYSFYNSLSYLFCPIARDAAETERMIDKVIDEMQHRMTLFAPYAKKSICNNLTRYTELSGSRLPVILVILDEMADVVEPGGTLEAKLIRIAKLGLAYGIHGIFATQRPSSKVATGEIQSQMASKFVTWMPTSREYGVVAQIPKDMYQEMPRVKGRFIVYSSKGWRYVQGRKVPDRALERSAARLAGKPREWQQTSTPKPVQITWGGTDADKVGMIETLARELDRKPSISEAMKRFKISKPTAIKYLQMWIEKA